MSMGSWRSLLFVPADARERLARAHLRGADGLIIDLEDGVCAASLGAVRAGLPAVISELRDRSVDVLVRINPEWRAALADLDGAMWPGLSSVMIPKVEDPGRLHVLSQIMTEFEIDRGLPVGGTGLVALVESPLGLAQAVALAAVPRVAALALGTEDFSLALGVAPSAEVLDLPCRQLALAAATRSLQCLAMPMSIAQLRDLDGFTAAADRAHALGCTGALCVHPSQVDIVNARFKTPVSALSAARRVLAAWEEAQAVGSAVVQLDGVMIDRPVAERARRLLQREAR
jgi:citrate lyase subunit beta/citryl-CoA lyase